MHQTTFVEARAHEKKAPLLIIIIFFKKKTNMKKNMKNMKNMKKINKIWIFRQKSYTYLFKTFIKKPDFNDNIVGRQ